jgi:hypothetical protein
MLQISTSFIVGAMQLIQIGVTKQKTIMELIQEMAANQFSEIEQLKAAARSRVKNRGTRRAGRRCGASQRQK